MSEKNIFKDENLYEIVKNACGGEITKEKLESLEHIDCDNNQLTSLDGLGACVALEHIDCRNNQLTSIPGGCSINT